MGVAARVQARNRVRRVLEFIDERVSDSISLDQMADIAEVSKFHFLRVYQLLTGETIGATRIRLKLNLARAMLANGLPVKDVAAAVGYRSAQALSHAFAEFHGQMPSKVVPGSGVPGLPARIVHLRPLEGIGARYRGRMSDVYGQFDRLIARCESGGAAVRPPAIMGTIEGGSLGENDQVVSMNCILAVDHPTAKLDRLTRPGGTFLAIRCVNPFPEPPTDLAAYSAKLRERHHLRFSDDYVLCWPGRDPALTAPSERIWDIHYPLVPA